MPRIPLADIPNAPQAPGAVLTNYPDFKVNFSGMAGALQQKGISEAPYQAAAAGLGHIGQAIEQVGGIANQFAMQKLEAQNAIDVAKAENLMSDYTAQKQGELQTLPPDQWNDHFSKGLPDLQKQIDALGVSPRAGEAIAANYTRWAGKTRANIGFDAAQTAVQNGRQEIKVAMDRAFKEGDMQQYVRLGTNMVKTGLGTQAEVDHGTFELEQAQKQEALQSANLSNPFEMQAEMEAAIKKGDGETESFGKLRPPELKKWLYAARQESRNQQIETRQDISNAIYSGDITDEQQIRDMANPVRPDGKKINILSEKEVKSLTGLLTREVQFNPEVATKLKTDVLGYDAATDKDMSQFNRINTDIETRLPKAEASALKSSLFQTWQQSIRGGKPTDVTKLLKADYMKRSDTLANQGLVGDGKTGRGDPKQKDKITNLDQYNSYWTNYTGQKAKLEKWFDENPKATPEEAEAQYQNIFGPQASQNAAKQMGFSRPSDLSYGNVSRSSVQAGYQAGLGGPAGGSQRNSNVSSDLVNFVKNQEGFSEKAYPDYKQNSVGYGTKAKSPNEVLNPQQAEARLREELSMHADRIDAAARDYHISDKDRNLLISFDFNTGKGVHLLESTGGDMSKIRERMKLYKNVTENGKLVENKGLVNRRNAELSAFQ